MTETSRFRVATAIPANATRLAWRFWGWAGLGLLSACAGGRGGPATAGYSTAYYVDHAQGSYAPPGPPNDPWGPYIKIASQKFDVPQAWIRGVMNAESGGHEYMDGQLTVSSAGAMGLMQLEPATYQEMAAQYGIKADPFNPYNNIMAGTAYIHEMYEVYGSPGFLAAYDAGPGRLDSYMNYHTPLPNETVNYVAEIAPHIQGYYPVNRSSADQLALNTLPENEAPGLVPPGFTPEATAPDAPTGNPLAPVQVAAITPVPSAASAIFAPEPPAITPQPATPPAPVETASAVYRAAPIFETPVRPVVPYAPPAPPRQPRAAPDAHPSFSLIQPAMADTVPMQTQHYDIGPAQAGWAIQVGAYASSSNARAALGIAELSAVRQLVKGRALVSSVYVQGHTRYRARVTGLPHDDAVDACNRLAGGPTGCLVLSPDAQS
ncbi:MAG: lytic transglycosylase domain-containing protein [Acidocella sp.]|nr:lytic transglycosylase domain-containing protein [Acidocella sp.]